VNDTIFLVIMVCLLILGIVFCLPLLILGNKSHVWRSYMGAPNPIELAKLGYFWNEEKQKYEYIEINLHKGNNNE